MEKLVIFTKHLMAKQSLIRQTLIMIHDVQLVFQNKKEYIGSL